MKGKGWMSYFLMVIILVVFSTIVLLLFAASNVFGKLDFSVVSEKEQATVIPYIIAYSELRSGFGEKAFFQQVSYFAAGEQMAPDKEAIMKYYASASSNNYIISLYSRYLASGGMIDDDKVSAAVIPIFTFEKKKESLEIKASG